MTGVVRFNDGIRKRNNLSCLLRLEPVTDSVVLDGGPSGTILCGPSLIILERIDWD